MAQLMLYAWFENRWLRVINSLAEYLRHLAYHMRLFSCANMVWTMVEADAVAIELRKSAVAYDWLFGPHVTSCSSQAHVTDGSLNVH